MSNITRQADTNEQEKSLEQVEEWAKNCDFRIRFGTTIGKSPQTVILDHNYQDGLIYVNADGTIKVSGEEVYDEEDFQNAIKETVEQDAQKQAA